MMDSFFFARAAGVFGLVLKLALFLIPPVLWFINRNKGDFSREIRIVAIIDAVYLSLLVVAAVGAGGIRGFFNGSWVDMLLGVAMLLLGVWKMKAGRGFGGLFKRPEGVDKFLFVVYIAVNCVVAIQVAISLVNYIIFGCMFIFLMWLLFGKLDILSMAFPGGGSNGNGYGGGNRGASHGRGTCSTCHWFGDDKCSNRPGVTISGAERACHNYNPIA